MEKSILIISQLSFSFFRTLNVRYTSKDKVFMSILTGLIVKSSWLISSYIGINAIINKEYFTALLYILSGILGDYLSFKIKIK